MKEVLPVLFSPTSKVRGAKRAVCSSQKQRKFFRVTLFTGSIFLLSDGCQQYHDILLIFARVQDSKEIRKHYSPVFRCFGVANNSFIIHFWAGFPSMS